MNSGPVPVISVYGIKPVTQGSMSAFGPGIVTDTHQSKLKPWRQAIQKQYKERQGKYYEQYTPIRINATFYFKTPKKPKSQYPCTKGADLDKLARGLGDALTGYAYFDDCQIVEWNIQKEYVDKDELEGVTFQIEECE